jgi:hypothetical protein
MPCLDVVETTDYKCDRISGMIRLEDLIRVIDWRLLAHESCHTVAEDDG